MLKLSMFIRDAFKMRQDALNSTYILKCPSSLYIYNVQTILYLHRMFRHIMLLVYMFILAKSICMLGCQINDDDDDHKNSCQSRELNPGTRAQQSNVLPLHHRVN